MDREEAPENHVTWERRFVHLVYRQSHSQSWILGWIFSAEKTTSYCNAGGMMIILTEISVPKIHCFKKLKLNNIKLLQENYKLKLSLGL